MSNPEPKKPNTITDGKFFNIDKAIENVKNIKTPIQLAAFVMLLVIIIVLYSKPITVNFLLFFVFTLPFFLIFLLFSNKSIAFFKSHKKSGLNVLITLIVIAFLFAIIPLYFVFANPALINTSSELPFSKQFSIGKAQEARKNENLIQNYTENYGQLSNFFFTKLNTFITDSTITNPSDLNIELQNKLQDLSGKISKLKGDNSYSIYGNDNIEELISKLQSSITNLYFSKYIFGIIYSCYNSQKGYDIDDIIDISKSYFDSTLNTSDNKELADLPADTTLMMVDTTSAQIAPSRPALSQNLIDRQVLSFDNEWYKLHSVKFSGIEAKMIHELGKDIVLKRIKDINANDVQKIKEAFNRIGIANVETNNTPNQTILNNFFKALSTYVDINTFNLRFYQLAYSDAQNQFSIYLSMYETGLIDFNKFILAFCPNKAQNILQKVLNQKLDLFTSHDASRLKNTIEGILKGKKSEAYSKYILDDAVSNYLNKFNEKNMQLVIESESVEEFVVGALKWECLNKNLKGEMPLPSASFLSLDLSFIIRMLKLEKFPILPNIAQQIDNSSDLFNSYKKILMAINLIESNLVTEIEE